ncbi:MAG: DUF86 domain-containing protein [Nanoarchaeota archaeon]|nr:DUF86 domain-containing protein [Nanoarchaeota archaeon]
MEFNIIHQKLKEIQDNLELITEHLPTDEEEFGTLGLVKDGMYKRLEFSIQNLVDIFSMIYSSLNLGVPADLDDIFEGLQRRKIFSKEIIKLVQEMKGLRNILIHRYGEINDVTIYGLLTERIADFDTIMNAIEKYIQKAKPSKRS